MQGRGFLLGVRGALGSGSWTPESISRRGGQRGQRAAVQRGVLGASPAWPCIIPTPKLAGRTESELRPPHRPLRGQLNCRQRNTARVRPAISAAPTPPHAGRPRIFGSWSWVNYSHGDTNISGRPRRAAAGEESPSGSLSGPLPRALSSTPCVRGWPPGGRRGLGAGVLPGTLMKFGNWLSVCGWLARTGRREGGDVWRGRDTEEGGQKQRERRGTVKSIKRK